MTPTPDADDWDPIDPAFRADPYPWYRALREQAPVLRQESVGYVISRHADIDALLRDDHFSVSTPSPWRELLAEHAAQLSPTERRRILRDNCVELFGLDAPEQPAALS